MLAYQRVATFDNENAAIRWHSNADTKVQTPSAVQGETEVCLAQTHRLLKPPAAVQAHVLSLRHPWTARSRCETDEARTT